MKLFKLLSASILVYLLFFASATQFVACQKETIYDTVIVKDTITIRDTVDCDCYDLKDGLVAWYNFKGGNLNDSSGKNNHIIFNNAVKTADRFGNANGAYLFNGTSNYMRVANNSSLNPTTAISLTAFIKINDFYTGTCHGNRIMDKAYGNDYTIGRYSLYYSDFNNCQGPLNKSNVKFAGLFGNNLDGQGPAAVSDSVVAQTGKWYCLVFTYENGTAKLYINGEMKDSRQMPLSFTPSPADLFIGKMDNSQYPYWFNGVMDDLRIYNRTLCAGEVKQLNRIKE